MGLDRRQHDRGVEEIDSALQKAATEAATRAGRSTARRASGGYFALVIILLVGAYFAQRAVNHRLDEGTRRVNQANVRLNDSELRACERVQAQRERTNVSEARQYLLLDAVTHSSRASAAVKARYGGLSRTTLYDPPTDCPAAVGHPGSYRRPPSVAFYATPPGFADRIVLAAKQKRPQPTLAK